MTSNLGDWINQELASSDLADEAQLLVLAALEGEEQLDDYLERGVEVDRPEPTDADAEAVEANGVVLTSICVEGFRGIGPITRLDIAPKPGLTVVTGRNGSGKSSLSEALELVLTGRNYRWENRSAEWIEQWRNIHHPSARVSVSLVEEGVGPIEVSAVWADDTTSVKDRHVSAQVSGQSAVAGTDHLGWTRALAQFRPILSYDELGGMLDGGQSKLYDALASILGVEELSQAVKRLKARHTALKAPGQTLASDRRALQQRAAASEDERAASAAALLRKTSPDIAALRALVTGGEPTDTGLIQSLRALRDLGAPDAGQVQTATAQLRQALNNLADAGAAVSFRNRARLDLLERGLELHGTHGDQNCPVCRTGDLDAAWRETSEALARFEREQFADVDVAQQDFAIAFDRLRKLVTNTPPHLATAPVPDLQSAVDDLRSAWRAWSSINASASAAGADALIDHVDTHLPRLLAAVTVVRDQAAREIAERDDEWQPLATAIGTWCDAAEAWAEQEPRVKHLTAAHKWLTDNDLRAKNERLAPIEEGARHAWATLRQESNVELDSLELAGSATRRRVKVSGAIDGEAVDSFAVFSQGELHALTLSLFLPRATLAASPFRFVVLDDPVQAMDPAKVDGLVSLLGELATSRQVIVFSHDDRLAAALRRSSYDATILSVTRGAQSSVSVEVAQDPATRYLDDARALITECKYERLAPEDLRLTLPGLYRFAIEAAAMDRFFAARLKAGDALQDLESLWNATPTTRKRVDLAVHGESVAEHVAAQWISPPHRKKALGIAAGGFHHGMKSWVEPDDAHRDVERLVTDLRAGVS